MRQRLLTSLLLASCVCFVLFAKAQIITQEMLDGHNGYFKTYEDFLNDRPIHFEELKFHHDKSQGKDHIIWSVTFEEGKTKTTLRMDEFWGYRFRHLLFRTAPDLDNGVIIVVAVGDMILYEGYHSAHLYISDDGNRATYESYALSTYISKTLGSEFFDSLSKMKPEASDKNPEIYDCAKDIGSCYLTFGNIYYVCKFPGYKKISHQGSHLNNNNKKTGGH